MDNIHQKFDDAPWLTPPRPWLPSQTFKQQEVVEAVRRFSRYYTRRLNFLNEKLLNSPFTLTEARIVFEVSRQPGITAAQIAHSLSLDTSFLSRTLSQLEKSGFIVREPSNSDRRELALTLTCKGQENSAANVKQSELHIQRMLSNISLRDQCELIDAMQSIEAILEQEKSSAAAYSIRTHQPGDIGWVIQRHAVLYAQEYGWDQSFEVMVGQIAIDFLKNHQPDHERCWIAEKNGINIGSVFLVRESKQIAKLRLLIVDPSARGLGVGRQLVAKCIRFARLNGYKTLSLWTNDILVAARRIYQDAGFVLVDETPHDSFGKQLVGQNWSLDLTSEALDPGRETPDA